MRTRLLSLLALAVLGVGLGLGCASPVPMARSALGPLQGGREIPVVYRTPSAPWVDCPGNFGVDTWKKDAALWESVQEQRTASLRKSPPLDPAGATAARFLLLSRAAPGHPSFRDRPLPTDTVAPQALSSRFGASPVLVFEATRWVLVGCFYTYQPWYDVRATLLDPSSGRVLWRDACGGLYPPEPRVDATPDELEANGKELYARMMEGRAESCASELLARFDEGMRAAGGGATPAAVR